MVDKGVYPLPDTVSYEEATFIEPLACVLRGQRIAGVRQGKTVLVIGSGISGLLHVQMARASGVSPIITTDIVEYRLKKAKELGADHVIDAKDNVPARLIELNDGRLADLVMLCTGAEEAMQQALASVERGGTVLLFAATGEGVTIPLSVNDIFWRNEITLTSSYAGSPEDHMEALRLITDTKVDVESMITHRLPLKDAAKGFQLVEKARDSIKVIIKPQE